MRTRTECQMFVGSPVDPKTRDATRQLSRCRETDRHRARIVRIFGRVAIRKLESTTYETSQRLDDSSGGAAYLLNLGFTSGLLHELATKSMQIHIGFFLEILCEASRLFDRPPGRDIVDVCSQLCCRSPIEDKTASVFERSQAAKLTSALGLLSEYHLA